MTSRPFDSAEPLVGPIYLIAALLVLTPVMDFATSVLPLRVDNIEWRFATVGLLSGFLLTPLLGLAIAYAVASWADHAAVLRILGILSLVVTGLFVVLLVFFGLDIVQLRSAVQDQARPQFQAAAAKAVVKHVCFIIALGWLGFRGLRAARWALPLHKRQASSSIIASS